MKLKNQSEFTQMAYVGGENGGGAGRGEERRLWLSGVGENLIDVGEIECRGVLRVWPQVLDGHGEESGYRGRE